MIDIHAHILPSLDDGPKDADLAFLMAKKAAESGIKKMIATPHCLGGELDLAKEVIFEAVAAFNKKLKEKGIPMEVYPGSEIYLDLDTPARFKEAKLLTLNNTGNYALIEFPMQSIPLPAQRALFELELLGITPILAHPERNLELIEKPNLLYELVSKGILVQINANSLTGAFGKEVARVSKLFLEHNLVHFIASDCHSLGVRKPDLNSAFELAGQIIGAQKAKTLVNDNPLKVLEGEVIQIDEPLEINLKGSSRWPWQGLTEKLKAKLFS